MASREMCPKCGSRTRNDWWQCGGSCPIPGSPYYKAARTPSEDVDGVVEKAREAIRQRVRNAWVGLLVEGLVPADLVEQIASGKTEWQALDALAAEIASLSAKVAEVEARAECAEKLAQSNYENICTQHRQIEEQCGRASELERKVERLREALKRIMVAPLIDHSHPENGAQEIARAALQQEGE